MPKVTDEYRATRRAEILTAAGHLFAENGFHATSMADIIAASGLSAGAVYRYFRSKEEIIGAAAETALSTADEIFARLLADGATPSPAHTMRTVIEDLLDRAAGDPGTSRFLTRIALQVWAEALRSPDLAERAGRAFERLAGHYTEVARRWQAAGNLPAGAVPAEAGAVMLGLTQGFVLQHLLMPSTTVATYTAGIEALLSRG